MPDAIKDILLLALLNPATLMVGYWLGRAADQPQKAIIAGFAAGIAGGAFAWALMAFGFTEPKHRLLAGVLALATVAGVALAMFGHWTRSHRDRGGPS
jgi:predicted Na+-dependent transporter